MACTPLGAERMRPTALRVSSGERASAGAWLAQVKEQTAPDFSSWNFSGAFSVWSSGRTNTALARSGMALSCSPPQRDTSRASGSAWRHWASTRLALGMLLWISAPEWPPGRPVSSSVQSFPEAGRRGRERARSHRAPPAQPTVSTPSSSLSRLMSIRPSRSEQSSPAAPSRPISSSTVNTASMGGWGMASSSSRASIMATAAPSSPPRVVFSARSQSPSRTSVRGSFSKSWSVPGDWTHTMSVCPWRITAGCPS